jgi:tetratricopeptide (TPR) repeat protein
MAKKALPTVKTAVKKLQDAGVIASLKPNVLKNLLDEMDLEPSDTIDAKDLFVLVDNYYRGDGVGSKFSFQEGYIAHDWRYGQETDDIVKEFCTVIGRPNWFQLTGINNDQLEVKSSSGEISTIDGIDLSNVAEFFNDRLKADGEDRQFYSLETDCDFFAFLLLSSEKYQSLSKQGLLPFVGTSYLTAEFDRESYYDRLASDATNDPLELVNAGKTLCRVGRSEQGLKQLSKALHLYQSDPEAEAYRGRVKRIEALLQRTKIYFAMAEFDKAMQDIDSIVSLMREPETIRIRGVEAYVMKGRSLTQLNQFNDALQAFRCAIEINEYDGSVYFYRAQTYDRLSKSAEANSDRSKANSLGFRQ